MRVSKFASETVRYGSIHEIYMAAFMKSIAVCSTKAIVSAKLRSVAG